MTAEQRARTVVDRYRDRLDRAEIDPDRLEAAIAEALTAQAAVLRTALDESVRLQVHYAHLLNDYDGGRRLLFANADAWIARLVQTRAVPLAAVEPTP
jgi:hypothetical protein